MYIFYREHLTLPLRYSYLRSCMPVEVSMPLNMKTKKCSVLFFFGATTSCHSVIQKFCCSKPVQAVSEQLHWKHLPLKLKKLQCCTSICISFSPPKKKKFDHYTDYRACANSDTRSACQRLFCRDV